MKSLYFLLTLLISWKVQAKPTIVAVVDMGINYHEVSNLKPYLHEPKSFNYGWDFSLDQPSSGIDYSYKYEQTYHGTFIAYLIARPEQINTQRIKILDVVYNDYFGNLFELNRYMFPENMREVYHRKKAYEKFSEHVASTFLYAERAGAKVINFSSADRGFASEGLKNYLSEAGKRGTIFVVSAGNDDYSLDSSPQYPCSYNLDNVICVGAVDRLNQKTSYSNYGQAVDFYALGNILTFEGTSFSAPIISRAVALIINKHPDWTPVMIRKELRKYSFKKNHKLVFSHKAFHKIYH